MATQVRETKAGSSISAYVVMNKKGVHVATVNAHFSNGGTVTVDVWNIGDKAAEACRVAASKCGALKASDFVKAVDASRVKRDWGTTQPHESFAAYDLFGLQQGRASGYGYDKFAAALSGLWIDGQQIADHCGTVANAEKAKAALFKAYVKECDGEWLKRSTREYWEAKAEKLGARFANFRDGRYQSLHFTAGLDRLTALGYTVIQAI